MHLTNMNVKIDISKTGFKKNHSVCVCEREIDREIERESGGREDAERPAEQIFLHAWSGS